MFVSIKIGKSYLSIDEKNLIVYTDSPDYGWKMIDNKIMTYYNQNIAWDGNHFKLQINEKENICYFEYNQNFKVLSVFIPHIQSYFYIKNVGILPTATKIIDDKCYCIIYDYKTKLGICNWDSVNKFNGDDMLKRGADKIKELNCNYIKIYIGRKSENTYNLNGLNNKSTLLDLIKHPSYDYVISKFQTIVFVAFSTFKSDDKYWRIGLTDKDKKMEYEEMSDFCNYLSKTYPYKNFIVQNWESDWCISDHKNNDYSSNMIEWLNIRGKAVRENGYNNIKYAVEVNQVLKTFYSGIPSALTKLFPYVQVDYISYSAYDSQHNYLEDCINLIKKYCNNVYIGEFGIDQLSCKENVIKNLINNTFKIASKTKCDYIFIWQLYNNEKYKMFGLYDDKDKITMAGHTYNNLLLQQ